MREVRVHIEEVVVREVFLKPHCPRIGRRIGLHWTEMPLAEVAAGVTRAGQDLRDGDFLRPDRPARVERSAPIRMTAGHHARPGWRAERRAGIEAVETESFGGHFVQDRRLHDRMPVVAGFMPSVVVTHQKHDVGHGARIFPGRGSRGAWRCIHGR